tara:strand:+ start:329 stop:601 length:273 start_codon:yes stop_codon:yes gene_type:complete
MSVGFGFKNSETREKQVLPNYATRKLDSVSPIIQYSIAKNTGKTMIFAQKLRFKRIFLQIHPYFVVHLEYFAGSPLDELVVRTAPKVHLT